MNPQYVYLLTKTIENLPAVVIEAIRARAVEKASPPGESLESLGKQLVTGLIKKSIDGQIGGAVRWRYSLKLAMLLQLRHQKENILFQGVDV